MTKRGWKIDFTRFGAYYLHKLSTMRYIGILQLIAGALSFPLYGTAFMRLCSVHARLEALQSEYKISPSEDLSDRINNLQANLRRAQDFETVSALICVAALVVMAIVIFVVPLMIFGRLYRKNRVDMDYSLPVSEDTRFFGDVLTGLSVAFGPLLLSCAVGHAMFYSPVCLESVNYDVEIFLHAVWGVFAAAVLFYCLNILVMALCANTFHAIALPWLINVALPLIYMFAVRITISFTFGRIPALSRETLVSAARFSPFALLLSIFYEYDSVTNPTVSRPDVMIPCAVMALVYIAAAWLIIRSRRAERVGSGYSSKPAQYAVQAITTLAVVLTAVDIAVEQISSNSALYRYRGVGYPIVIGAAVSAVLFFVMEILSGSGKKRFIKSLPRYAAGLGGSAVIVAVLIFSNGFGIYSRAPKAKNVREIDMYISLPQMRTFHVTDPDEIAAVTELHSDIVKGMSFGERVKGVSEDGLAYLMNLNEPSSNIDLKYTDINGSEDVFVFEADKDTLISLVKKLDLGEHLLRNYDYKSMNELENVVVTNAAYSDLPDDMTPLTGLTYAELFEAIRKDCEGATYERLYECEAGVYAKNVTLEVSYDETTFDDIDQTVSTGMELRLYPWFENTAALLRESGFDIDFDIHADRYDTAFLVKFESEENVPQNYYARPFLVAYDAPYLFGLAGDERFTDYALEYSYIRESWDSYEDYYKYEIQRYVDDADESYVAGADYGIIPPLEERAVNVAKRCLPGVSAEFIDIGAEDTKKLIEGSGNVIPCGAMGEEHYAVVLANDAAMVISSDISSTKARDDMLCEILYVTQDNAEFAKQLFDSLSADNG